MALKQEFNGGKMEHIFKFVPKTKSDLYMKPLEFASDEAKDAFIYGITYEKIDGANGLLKLVDGEIVAFERQDKKNMNDIIIPDGHIDIPAGENAQRYSNHTYFYRKIDIDKITGKKAKPLAQKMLNLLIKHEAHLRTYLKEDGDFVTIEWVGKKFQQTPGVEDDVAICIHLEQIVYNVPRDEHFSTWLLSQNIEGIIFEHEGKCWKVRTGMIDSGNIINKVPKFLN